MEMYIFYSISFHFILPYRFGNSGFSIRHFAGEVTYSVAEFLRKNNMSLQDDLLELMHISQNKFITNIVNHYETTEAVKNAKLLEETNANGSNDAATTDASSTANANAATKSTTKQ